MSKNTSRIFRNSLYVSTAIIILIWAVELYEVWSGNSLVSWGIYPRAWDGILGIITAPFVHGDWGHIISNTSSLFLLLIALYYFYPRTATPTLFLVTILTGLLVWLFARNAYHVGASGILYALVSHIFWSGIFRRNRRAIILALIILSVYSGYFEGIVPDSSKENVSWESHLMGGIAGIVSAFVFKNVTENDEIAPKASWANDDQTERPFLPRDAFEMTKYQRYLAELQRRKELEEHYRMINEERRSQM